MSKKIVVNKVGGGILLAENFPILIDIIRNQISAGLKPVVVVSALPKVTDKLLRFTKDAYESNTSRLETNTLNKSLLEIRLQHIEFIDKLDISKEIKAQITHDIDKEFEEIMLFLLEKEKNQLGAFLDKIVSKGEKMSSILFAGYLSASGLPAESVFAENIPIVTDFNFQNANIDYISSQKTTIKCLSKSDKVAVIAGFTGVTTDGDTTTLGRGGTDTTACFVGAALKAEKVILWKDVGGVSSADPKIVKNPNLVKKISYKEALEVGKIIHEKAVNFLKMNETPIEIRSIFEQKSYSVIGKFDNRVHGTKFISFKNKLILFVVSDENITTQKLLYLTSGILSDKNIDIILISNVRHKLQFVIEDTNGLFAEALEEVKKHVQSVEVMKVNMVFLVGNFNVSDVNKLNHLLIEYKSGLQISAFLYEDCTRLEAVVESDDIEGIVKMLHHEFIKPSPRGK